MCGELSQPADVLLLMPYSVEQYIPHLLSELVLRCSQSSHEWFAVTTCSCSAAFILAQLFSSVFAVSTKTCLQLSSWSLLCAVLTFTLNSYTKSEISFHLLYCFGRMESVYCHNCSPHTELTPKRFTEISRYSVFTVLITSWVPISKKCVQSTLWNCPVSFSAFRQSHSFDLDFSSCKAVELSLISARDFYFFYSDDRYYMNCGRL